MIAFSRLDANGAPREARITPNTTAVATDSIRAATPDVPASTTASGATQRRHAFPRLAALAAQITLTPSGSRQRNHGSFPSNESITVASRPTPTPMKAPLATPPNPGSRPALFSERLLTEWRALLVPTIPVLLADRRPGS